MAQGETVLLIKANAVLWTRERYVYKKKVSEELERISIVTSDKTQLKVEERVMVHSMILF